MLRTVRTMLGEFDWGVNVVGGCCGTTRTFDRLVARVRATDCAAPWAPAADQPAASRRMRAVDPRQSPPTLIGSG
jgi:hypothetical protein